MLLQLYDKVWDIDSWETVSIPQAVSAVATKLFYYIRNISIYVSIPQAVSAVATQVDGDMVRIIGGFQYRKR